MKKLSYDELEYEVKILTKENRRLFKMAYYDNLTECYNRHWLYENINDNDEYKITLIDVNKLKVINDQYGHLMGDKYLMEIVKFLKEYGTVVRYGGDEFIIMSPVGLDEKIFEDPRFCSATSIKSKNDNFWNVFEKIDRELYKKKEARKDL